MAKDKEQPKKPNPVVKAAKTVAEHLNVVKATRKVNEIFDDELGPDETGQQR